MTKPNVEKIENAQLINLILEIVEYAVSDIGDYDDQSETIAYHTAQLEQAASHLRTLHTRV